MRNLRIQIECENAAFFDNGLTNEVSFCIAQVIAGINDAKTYRNIKDSNGNVVGSYRFIDEVESR